MRAEDIHPFLAVQPFAPLRVCLSDGSSFEVRHPEMVILTRWYLDVGHPGALPHLAETAQRYSLLHIVKVETLQPRLTFMAKELTRPVMKTQPCLFSRSYALRTAIILCLCGMIASLFTSSAAAAEAKKDINPTGTWKYSITTQNGQTIESTVKLKLDGDKLSGVFIGRNANEVPLEEAKIKGDEVSFKVTRERQGQKVTTSYSGKLSGDTIKGKLEFPRDGETRTRDWEAKRERLAADPTGTWKWSYNNNGNTVEPTLKLKLDGETLTGFSIVQGREAKVLDGKFKDGEVSFRIVRERDGQSFTTRYHGKLDGDTITGKVELTLNGEDRSFDWLPKRVKE